MAKFEESRSGVYAPAYGAGETMPLKTINDVVVQNSLLGSYSKATTTNPKDLLGAKKVSISKLPFVAILHGAHAMGNGAAKYGPYNWRAKKVQASIYVDAIYRHLGAWFDSHEEIAEDSGVHHLGHLIASAAILLDAMETGNLVDDRPQTGQTVSVLKRLNETIKNTPVPIPVEVK